MIPPLFRRSVIHQPSSCQSPPKPNPRDNPFVVEYYYKAKWGHADEFLKLFKKNHYPAAEEGSRDGPDAKVWMDQPRYHTTEDGRWDYRVTIVFKNATVANEPFDEAALRNSFGPIRILTYAKSSAASRSSTPTGTCRSRPWIWMLSRIYRRVRREHRHYKSKSCTKKFSDAAAVSEVLELLLGVLFVLGGVPFRENNKLESAS